MPKFIDITGQRFGRLIAVSPAHRAKNKIVYWLCRCDCGGTKVVGGNNLRCGQTKSCGCLQIPGPVTHGQARVGSHTGAYRSWASMWNRCTHPSQKGYDRYKDRPVCERWQFFENFYADMGDRPAGLTLDRIDNHKGYFPGNCRWATYFEQRHNRG
jgi:hypothetical protein